MISGEWRNPNGIWGALCGHLKAHNNIKTRKKYYTIWASNRYDVKRRVNSLLCDNTCTGATDAKNNGQEDMAKAGECAVDEDNYGTRTDSRDASPTGSQNCADIDIDHGHSPTTENSEAARKPTRQLDINKYKFKFKLTPEEWTEIKPADMHSGLAGGYANLFYEKLNNQMAMCPLYRIE